MQKIFKLLFFLCIFGFLFSCISTDYIKTGNEYPSLAESDDIKVFTSSKPEQKYEMIGLIRIRGGSLEKRQEEAKAYAREKGGNAVIAREIGILTEPGTDNVVEQIGTSTYETQEFVIIKIEGGRSVAKSADAKDNTENDDLALSDADMPDKPTSLDYSTIPRATYNQLINDYKSLQGKMFRGMLYPKKIYKIPSALRASTERGDRLILLSTKSGKSSLYLIISNDKISAFHNKIKSGEVLDFVYSPVQVYTSKAGTKPVIKFVEEIVRSEYGDYFLCQDS